MKRGATISAALMLASAAALGSDGTDLEVRVRDPSGKAAKKVPVYVRVKSFPAGRFSSADHEEQTDAKGRALLKGVIPQSGRYGVWASVIAPGKTLAGQYHWTDEGGPMEPVDLEVAPAHPLRLRFLDDDGKVVSGVLAYPSSRDDAAGNHHTVGVSSKDAFLAKSGKKGVVAMEFFLPGEWAGVQVRFPDGRWGRRHLLVPGEKRAIVDVPRTAPVTPDMERTVGDDTKKRYFLMGPKAGDIEPERGFALVLILPGGPGDSSFREWVRERYDEWVGAGFVWAQLVAPKWIENQVPVWPTKKAKLKQARFTTEEFVSDVVREVSEHVKIDSKRVFTVSWSSSGPACYRIASLKRTPVTGSLVAMSVFHRNEMDSLRNTRKRPFFILHSPTDAECPLRLAEDAREALSKNGAIVEWATYEGGHGWNGRSEEHARRALRWLWDQTE